MVKLLSEHDRDVIRLKLIEKELARPCVRNTIKALQRKKKGECPLPCRGPMMPINEIADRFDAIMSNDIKPDSLSKAGENEAVIPLNVDCEEALKGMKAIQREARKTTHSLNELSKAGLPITDIGRMIVHPDDVIVIYTNHVMLDKKAIEAIQGHLKPAFPKNKIIVFPSGWNITAAGLETDTVKKADTDGNH